MPHNELTSVTERFMTALASIVEELTAREVDRLLRTVFGDGASPGSATAAAHVLVRPARRPKQLCPVPGCKNPAAPVFGMVCREHKSVPKATIKKYRAERRGDFSHLTAERTGSTRARGPRTTVHERQRAHPKRRAKATPKSASGARNERRRRRPSAVPRKKAVRQKSASERTLAATPPAVATADATTPTTV